MAENTGLYRSLENKYYDFLDMLEARGIPVYKLVNAIEAQNIPTFPIAILLSIAVLALLAWGIAGILAPAQGTLTVVVQDSGGSALSGAIVTVTPASGQSLPPTTTNRDGEAKFGVPLNQLIKAEAKKEGHSTESESTTVSAQEGKVLIILSEETGTEHKTISLVKYGTNELVRDSVTVQFSCSGSGWKATETTTNGRIELDVPGDCGTMYAFPQGGYSTSNDSFGSGDAFTMYLSQEEAGKGIVIASVTDKDGKTISGIDVSLFEEGMGRVITLTTPASGMLTFKNIPAGRYYPVTYDATGTYAEYDGSESGNVKSLQAGGSVEFGIVLGKAAVGTIKIYARDKETLEGISGAKISLSKGGTQIKDEFTGNDGKVTLYVGEDVAYDVTIDKAGYLIENLNGIMPSADFREVMLAKATEQNSRSLAVTVQDERGAPVEDARLVLKLASDGTPVGSELVTGANGRARFERLEAGTYYVYAYKPGYGDGSSAPVTVSGREEATAKVTINIGEGGIGASVLDEQGQPVGGARVRLVNARAMETMQDSVADAQGYVKFGVRIDKKVFLIASSQGFMQHTTVPLQAAKDTTQDIEIRLVKAVPNLQVKLLGIYTGGQQVGESDGMLNAGGLYTAKLQLLIPEGASFNEAGVHVRTGAADSTIMEKDYLYITNVRAAYSSVMRGTSYNPPNGYAKDAEHLTSGNAKWANVNFTQVGGGVYDVEADIQVSGAAANGTALDLWYRGWGKAGSYVRFPADTALGGAESNAEKQALYAQANNRHYTAGIASPCYGNFCANFLIEDLDEGLKTAVIDEYVARAGGRYSLAFSVNSISESVFGGAKLKIYDSTGSLALGDYEILTAAGENKKGAGKGGLVELDIGDISKDGVVQGRVNFSAVKEGTALLEVSVVSDAEKVFTQEIRFNIEPAKAMVVEVVPKVIVPYVNNNMLIHVADESGASIANARIALLKDGAIIADGETDSSGVFPYTLLAPSAGSVLRIEAEKTGYKKAALELTVNENILNVKPQKIKETLTLGSETKKEVVIILRNLTVIPLALEEMQASGEFKDYVAFDFGKVAAGALIDVNADSNATFGISVTGKGNNITAPKTTSGSVGIYVSNPEFGRTWVTQVPAEVRIGFGAEVDDAECFGLYPTDWKLFTGTAKKTLAVTLTNSCTVSGEPVALKKLQARLVPSAQNELGKFRVSSELNEGGAVELSNKFQTITMNVPAGESASEPAQSALTLEFLPADIASGGGEFTLEFVAVNYTEGGDEQLKQKIKAEVHIDNLAQCVEIVQDRDLVIETAGYNTGWGNYGNNFWNGGSNNYFNPMQNTWQNYGMGAQNYGMGMQNYGGANPMMDTTYRGTGTPNYMGSYNYLSQQYYPSASWSYPFQASDYYDSRASSSWGVGGSGTQYGGATKFTVKNNCASGVDIELDVDPALTVQDGSFKIDSTAGKDVEVRSAYAIGRYAIKVKAKVAGSTEAAAEVKTVYVTVENAYTKNYMDCISVEPARTIKFNDFLAKAQTLTVTNTCYNEGVRLMPTTSGINFSGASTPVQSEGVGSEVVKQWAVLGAPMYQSMADGKVMEKVKYEIIKNIAWHDRAKQQVSANNPVRVIANIRYEVSAAYYAVEERTTLYVNFTNKYGQSQSVPFSMILEDYWELGPFVEQYAPTFGSACPSNSCINTDAMNFYKTYNGDCIPDEHLNRVFSSADNGGVMKISQNARDPKTGALVETSGFGSGDTIAELTVVGDADDGKTDGWINIGHGARAQFTIAKGKQNINMKLDLSNRDGEKIDGSVKLLFTINRMSPGLKSAEQHSIMVTFCIKAGKTGKALTEEEKLADARTPKPAVSAGGVKCDTGGAFGKYGFDKLLWDWRFTGDNVENGSAVTRLACNSQKWDGATNTMIDNMNGAKFCDGTQFMITLEKKAEMIANILNAHSGELSCGFCGTDAQYRTSENLWRWALKQVAVPDAYAGDTFYFILADAGEGKLEVLERSGKIGASEAKEFPQLAITATEVTNESGKSNAAEIFTSVTATLRNTENQKKGWFSDVLAVVKDETGDSQGHKEAYESLGMNHVELYNKKDRNEGTIGAWFMTLGEFYALDKAIKEAGDQCKSGTCTFKLALWDDKTKTRVPKDITLDSKVLQDIYKNIEFVYGIRNYAGTTPAERDEAMLNGASVVPNLLQFYKENIDFQALLIKDGYGKGFTADFKAKYPNEIINDGAGWNFTKGALAESGNYSALLNYKWDKDMKASGVDVTAVKKQGLADIDGKNEPKTAYVQNPFMNMAFDGDVGLDKDGVFRRSGYGILMKLEKYEGEAVYARYSANPSYAAEYKMNKVGSTGEPLNTYSLHYNYDWENTSTGRILELTGNTVKFNPTDPVVINLQIDNKGPLKKETIGFVYDISNKVWSLKTLSKDGRANPLDWIVQQNSMGGTKTDGDTIKGELEHPWGICFARGIFNDPTVSYEAEHEGHLILRSIVYAPVNVTFEGAKQNKIGPTKFEILCTDDRIQKQNITILDDKSTVLPSASGTDRLNGTEDNRLSTHYTWKQLFEMISDNGTTIEKIGPSQRANYVCVDTSNGGMTLLWNEDYILNQLSPTGEAPKGN
ncbi:MAG: carboxypeptidase regulatory-like domain-containing protein [Candidatus Diapherotrites archaeon]